MTSDHVNRKSVGPARGPQPASERGHSGANRAPAIKNGQWLEGVGILAVITTTVYFIVLSWRKWCHPIVDSGRELYTPWRLSEGAVLYRDVDDVYGPLSQYFNAALFKLFGPGMMVLAVANLVIFAGILGLAYLLFRRAWGAVGALGASVVFVTVFAFCPLLDINIFNYALPYSHEATHGMLVMVGLIVAVGRWVEVPRVRWCGVAGGLVGLALVLKPEFIFAAAVLVVTAVILRRRQWPQRGGMSVLVFALAALVPTAVFTCYFMRYFPPLEALSAAGRAWWSLLIMPDILAKNYQLSFIGLDSPWANLAQHLHKTALVVTCIGVLGVLVAVGLLRSGASKLVVLSFATAAALVAGLSADWGSSGRSLLGLLLCYVTFRFWRGGQSASKAGSIREPQAGWRILITAGAVAMMARMFLKGRIVQFGFFQAALAGMVATAIICSEAAEWLPGTRWRRAAVAFIAAALFAPGLWWAGKRAHDYYSWQTLPVADARDRFYHFEPEIEASGQLMNEVLGVLREVPRETTLLALPEGSMVNYLARLRSPLPQFQYYSFTTEAGREKGIVDALRLRPPDRVVVISRFGLGDFGIVRYGERDGAGRQIIEWVNQNYRITHRFGGDPLATDQRGAYILSRIRD